MNKLYIIGSHNSLTYAKSQWYLRPIRFTAKCQEVDYKELYELHNVRLFDLRVRFKNNKPYVCHGIFKFDVNINKFLSYLNSKKDCYCRIMLEFNSEPFDKIDLMYNFILFCITIQDKYKDIKFFGGNMKYSGLNIFKFYNEIELDGYYSSVSCGNPILKLLPKRYAKKFNSYFYLNGTDKLCLFVDFVNIK